jgi:hypothetical protein
MNPQPRPYGKKSCGRRHFSSIFEEWLLPFWRIDYPIMQRSIFICTGYVAWLQEFFFTYSFASFHWQGIHVGQHRFLFNSWFSDIAYVSENTLEQEIHYLSPANILLSVVWVIQAVDELRGNNAVLGAEYTQMQPVCPTGLYSKWKERRFSSKGGVDIDFFLSYQLRWE